VQLLDEATTAALFADGTAAAKVEILRDGAVVATSDGENATLDVTDGEITVDRSAAIRREARITIVDPTGLLVPDGPSDLLSTTQALEFKPYRGVVLPDGTTTWFPQGVFDIAAADTTFAPDELTIAVSGFDRSRRVSRARISGSPYVIAAGTNYGTAIDALVVDRLGFDPGTTVTATTHTTPLIVLAEQQDPWESIQQMAAAIGQEAFFDVEGRFCRRPEPDLTDPDVAIDFTYEEGEAGILAGGSRGSGNERAYNGVIWTGQGSYADGAGDGTGRPARGEAWDTNPSSPTYYLGRYGRVPYFHVDEFTRTDTQAADAAAAHLLRVMGATETVTIDVAGVNPAHDASDVIHIKQATVKLNDTFMVERFNVPLRAANGQQITTRERRLT
jgi:hypothetical protein